MLTKPPALMTFASRTLVGAFSVITNLRMDFVGALVGILRLLSVQQAAAHLSRRLRRERRSCFPIMFAELIIFSLLITSRTCIPDMEQNQSNFTNYIRAYIPIAQATGLPPNVEKYPPSLSPTSLLQITAPIGNPLPRP